jgi:hypothetical protein
MALLVDAVMLTASTPVCAQQARAVMPVSVTVMAMCDAQVGRPAPSLRRDPGEQPVACNSTVPWALREITVRPKRSGTFDANTHLSRATGKEVILAIDF